MPCQSNRFSWLSALSSIVVSSFDLIPDSVPVLGLMDDVWVINFEAGANLRVISSFLAGITALM